MKQSLSQLSLLTARFFFFKSWTQPKRPWGWQPFGWMVARTVVSRLTTSIECKDISMLTSTWKYLSITTRQSLHTYKKGKNEKPGQRKTDVKPQYQTQVTPSTIPYLSQPTPAYSRTNTTKKTIKKEVTPSTIPYLSKPTPAYLRTNTTKKTTKTQRKEVTPSTIPYLPHPTPAYSRTNTTKKTTKKGSEAFSLTETF